MLRIITHISSFDISIAQNLSHKLSSCRIGNPILATALKSTMAEHTIYKRYDDGYIVRKMTEHDTHFLLQRNSFGDRNYRAKNDLYIAMQCFPDIPAFYIGEYGNEIVSCALYVPWGENIYYGSSYYVIQNMRSRGFGTRLHDNVISKDVGKNIFCFDSVLGDAPEKNEEKFRYVKRFLTHTFIGTAKEIYTINSEYNIKSAKDVNFEDLISYDNKCFISRDFIPRRKFIRLMLDQPDCIANVAINNDGQIVGKGYIRPSIKENHMRVGPLYADSYEIAEDILKSLLLKFPGVNTSIDIWQPNQCARKLMNEFEMTKFFTTIRMHLNGDAQELKEQVFAITSQEVCGF